MLWVGVTGSMGSGKSTVADLLRQRGYPVLDADAVAREVIAPGTPGEAAVFRTFGESVRNLDGTLDRRALGRIVFSDPDRLSQLERLIHPFVRQEIATARRRLEAQGYTAAFYDVPLLFEKKMENQFDHIIVVSAAPEVRRKRLKARSGLTDEEITTRWSQQMSPEEKESRASVVIRNEAGLNDLEKDLTGALAALGVPLGPVTTSHG
ncbi:MAG: dephospho-CoA kinase [Bdellovibrionales bacterium]